MEYVEIIISGYFEQILSPLIKKKIKDLDCSELAQIHKRQKLENTIYGGEIGIFGVKGVLRRCGNKWTGEMYDVFGKSSLSEVVITKNRLEFVKTYPNRSDKPIRYLLESSLKSSEIDFIITDKNISELTTWFCGIYRGIEGDVSQDKVSIIFEISKENWEVPEELEKLSLGW